MSYMIKEANASKVVLAPPGSTYITGAIILGVIGGAGLYFGYVNRAANPQEVWPIVLMVFGLIFAAGAIAVFVTKGGTTTLPPLITFDNSKGAVVIEMDQAGTQTGYIRYDEIEKFDIQHETRSGKTTSHYYHVYLKKKDGGRWFLTVSGTRPKAEDILQQLNTLVALKNPVTVQLKATLSDKLEKEEKSDKTTIFWHNAVTGASFIGPAAVVLFLAAVVVILIVSGSTTIALVVGAVAALVVVGTVQKTIKDATTRYGVSVGKQNLEYNEFDKTSGAVKSTKAIPLQDLHSVTYSFNAPRSLGEGVMVWTHQQHNTYEQSQSNLMEAIKTHISLYKDIVKLDIRALNPVECLQLEFWLQELIKKKGNEKVG